MSPEVSKDMEKGGGETVYRRRFLWGAAVVIVFGAICAIGFAVSNSLPAWRASKLLDEAADHYHAGRHGDMQGTRDKLVALGPGIVGFLVETSASSEDPFRAVTAGQIAAQWLLPSAGLDDVAGVTAQESRYARALVLSKKAYLLDAIRSLDDDASEVDPFHDRASAVAELAALSGDAELITELARVTLSARDDRTKAKLVYVLGTVLANHDVFDAKAGEKMISAGTLRAVLSNATAYPESRRSAMFLLESSGCLGRRECEVLLEDANKEIAQMAAKALREGSVVEDLSKMSGLKGL